ELLLGDKAKSYIDNLYVSIKEDINKAGYYSGLSKVDDSTLETYFETAKKEYLSVNPIDPGISHSLTKKGFQSWLTKDREVSLTWNYSDRYFKYLLKSGRSQKVVDETKRSSLEIIRKIADPESKNETYVKGLVVGAVQSGKTGNFNAVINRAIDTGYGLVIVLSGIMEDLRSQTQKRIETDVIGEGRNIDSNTRSKKGVGEISRFGKLGNSPINQVKAITSIDSDFSRALLEADFSLNDINVLVCKKNVSVLRNLIVWLHDYLDEDKERHNIPLLILDDEADNASLNNLGAKGRNYASKTNSQIRALLALFNRKTYLGYTATPFANVLQDRNDIPDEAYIEKYKVKGERFKKELSRVDNIFPDDFIELLDPPSNYVGAKQIFETINPIQNNTDENEKIPLVAPPVDDYIEEFPSRVYRNDEGEIIGIKNITSKTEWNERFGFGGYLDFDTYSDYKSESWAPKKDEVFPKKLPESLIESLNCFIITLAIRETRIPNMQKSQLFQPHNTMLIHISRFTFWQNRTKELVEKYIDEVISRISNEKPSSDDSIYSELERTWYKHYAHIVENIHNYLPTGYDDPFMVPIVFDSLKRVLPTAIKGIEVKAINSLTGEKLEYPKHTPKKIIAVGGNRLSRGFTLEGLTINYFIRTTNYSDALLQMGRWFGYRPGYLDCCKIFTSQGTLDKFNSTTQCIEELESEFIKMEEQEKSPKNFILRVKKHPGTLKITRPSILKNTKSVNWSYADQLKMTTQFRVDKSSMTDIWRNFTSSISPKFDSRLKDQDDIITYETTSDEIIKILRDHPNNFNDKDPEFMSRFIELSNEKGYLNNWTIGLKITGRSENPKLNIKELNFNPNLGIEKIKLAQRSGPISNEDDRRTFLNDKIFKASGKSANILSSNEDTAILLSDLQKSEAKENFYFFKAKELQKKGNSLSFEDLKNQVKQKFKTIPERYYREKMKDSSGLLLIYLFDSRYAFNKLGSSKLTKHDHVKKEFADYVLKNKIDLNIPLVGYAIEFPPLSEDIGGEYMQGDYDLQIDEDLNSEVGDDDESIINDNE
ncbi:MAG: Z1 domain-containing protein, partial [Labilibaculum sp.]|nr:Z1 domain-containing protein [Labilibaculum sp.]